MRPIRVVSAQYDQYYHRLLYDQLRPYVEDAPLLSGHLTGPDGLGNNADIFHLHSPEDLPLGADVNEHQRFAESLDRSGIRLVWTQHNFHPHDKSLRAAYQPIYDEWARRADTIIHHSQWGMRQCQTRLPFRTDAKHFLVPHGHFGPLMPELPELDPEDCRVELGLEPGKLCLGIIGHPRAEKRTMMAMDAFVAADRQDMQLLVLSLGDHDCIPTHPLIVALRHKALPRCQYNRRLRSIDVALMPFESGMLTTGSVADVIALGIPAAISVWPFLSEMLGDAGIVYGDTQESLTSCIADLAPERILSARTATRALRSNFDYSVVASLALTALQATMNRPPSSEADHGSSVRPCSSPSLRLEQPPPGER